MIGSSPERCCYGFAILSFEFKAGGQTLSDVESGVAQVTMLPEDAGPS